MPEKTIRELNAEFLAHRNESDRRHNELGSKIRDVEKALESKVSYKTFMLIFTILTGILGYMIWQMNDIREKTTTTAVNVSGIIHDYGIRIEDNPLINK